MIYYIAIYTSEVGTFGKFTNSLEILQIVISKAF